MPSLDTCAFTFVQLNIRSHITTIQTFGHEMPIEASGPLLDRTPECSKNPTAAAGSYDSDPPAILSRVGAWLGRGWTFTERTKESFTGESIARPATITDHALYGGGRERKLSPATRPCAEAGCENEQKRRRDGRWCVFVVDVVVLLLLLFSGATV